MPDLELDIKQLADNGGTEPFAPITVPEAVMFSNGDSLSDKIGNTNISSIGSGSITSAIAQNAEDIGTLETNLSAIRNNFKQFVFFDSDTSHNKTINAYSAITNEYDIYTDFNMPSGGVFIAFQLYGDRNTSLITCPVSTNGPKFTFRTYNPTNTTQTAGGLVCIGKYWLG